MRALENLDGESASALEGMAVYRKAVTGNGIALLLRPELALGHFLSALSSRFLLVQRAGWYSLNPVVREIALHRLKTQTHRIQVAHRAAAGFYTRHFAARQIVNAGSLGGAFVEARYHLVQADEMAELAEIAQRFGDHLRSLYGWVTPEVRGEGRRDEIIGVLSAYLQDGGPKGTEYYLARLLYSRNHPGDGERALSHSRRSTGPQSPAEAWVLRLRLEAKVAGIESMLRAARVGFSEVSRDANLFAVYQVAADQLALADRTPEAIDLVQEGISKIPPENGLFSLYLAGADLLATTGELGDAILLLREGLVAVPKDDLFYLYVRAAQLLVAEGNVEIAVGLLVDGIDRVSPNKGLSAVYETLAELLVNEEGVDSAVNLLKQGAARIPWNKGLFGIYRDMADYLIGAGRDDDAVQALDLGLRSLPTGIERERLQSKIVRIHNQKRATRRTDAALVTGCDSSREAPSPHAVALLSPPAAGRLSILTVGTEWESRHGGLSTFNRDLCIELAAAGHRVICVVPEATDKERSTAETSGVQLICPAAQPGLEGTELLLTTALPPDFEPALVIGHDRKTGPHARALTQRYAHAKFVLFLHTRPEDIEWHKDKLGPDDAATTSEQRKRMQETLASSAALVVGVGPVLATSARTLVYLAKPSPIVHQLDPGFRLVDRPADLPPESQCLLLGRAEDFSLKGLDIAARALGEVTRRNRLDMPPRLIVRGAPIGTGVALRAQLIALGGGELEVEVRNYSPDVELLRRDIQNASLVLMPSRSEGFGLVGLEAIAANTPVLLSSRSGLAKLLSTRLGQHAHVAIVDTYEDLAASSQEWERNIEGVLIDRQAAFLRAQTLRGKLKDIFDWPSAIRLLEGAWEPLLGGSS